MWALDALVVCIRVAADRASVDVAQICERVAQRRGVDLAARTDAQNLAQDAPETSSTASSARRLSTNAERMLAGVQVREPFGARS